MKLGSLSRYMVSARRTYPTREDRPKPARIVLATSSESAKVLAKALFPELAAWQGGLKVLNIPSFKPSIEMQPCGVAVSIRQVKGVLKTQYILLDRSYNVLCVRATRELIMREYRMRNISVFYRNSDTHAPALRFVPHYENGIISIIDNATQKEVKSFREGRYRMIPKLPLVVKEELLNLSKSSVSVLV